MGKYQDFKNNNKSNSFPEINYRLQATLNMLLLSTWSAVRQSITCSLI